MDTKEITLPSGMTAVIRTYTTREDDLKSQAVQFEGAYVINDETRIPLDNGLRAQEVYVNRLTQEINGDPKNILNRLSQLRSTDYAALKEEITKIVNLESPKAIASNESSPTSTTEK